MELIIKIPEYRYNSCKANLDTLDLYEILADAVRKGKVLPKGHGDLIDRNSILCDDLTCDLCGYTDECFKLLAPTIIEADKKDDNTRPYYANEWN